MALNWRQRVGSEQGARIKEARESGKRRLRVLKHAYLGHWLAVITDEDSMPIFGDSMKEVAQRGLTRMYGREES